MCRAHRTDLVHKARDLVRHAGVRTANEHEIVWLFGPMALGLMGLDGASRCVLCLEPKDRHVADVVGSPDLDQRLPTLEAGGSNLGREDFANRPGAPER